MVRSTDHEAAALCTVYCTITLLPPT